MRDRLFRFRRAAIAVLTGATVLGGVSLVGAGSASADISGGTWATGTATTIYPGQSGQAAATWTMTLPNTFAAGDKFQITVAPNTAAHQCSVAGDYIGFSVLPSITVTPTATTTETAPTFTGVLSASTAAGAAQCTAAGIQDVYTVTENATPSTGVIPWTVTISGIEYTTGAAVDTGAIKVTGSYENNTQTSYTAFGTPPASNATVNPFLLAGNTPAVALPTNGTAQAISNIAITDYESTIPAADIVCIALSETGSGGTSPVFTSGVTPTVTPSGSATIKANSATATGNTFSFVVGATNTAGTSTTYTVGGIEVDTTGTNLGPVTATMTYGTGTTCPGASAGAAGRAFSVLASSRIQGSDADATAVAEVQQVYSCATINNAANGNTGLKSAATVILATDSAPYDALAASFLAGNLQTGILLTTPSSLSASTQAALRQLGIANVIVVGGPVAVSDTVVQQLQALQAYGCNGSPVVTNGVPQTLTVTRIQGATALDTAAAIAQYQGSKAVRQIAVPGAYNNLYNDTTGTASATGPTAATSTLILATDNGFQDAVAASAAAYNYVAASKTNFPIALTDPGSLSSQAAAVITNLNIGQVILMGGPVAVSNNVVTQLQALNVSVLRIAGQDLTDTASMLAAFELNKSNSTGVDGLNWGTPTAPAAFNNTIYVARGDFYSDGLVGGVVAGSANGGIGDPLLLTLNPSTVGAGLTAFLNAVGAPGGTLPVYTVTVFGGTQAVTPTTVSTMLQDLSAG